MSKPLQVKHLHTDVLIIGGGTAGCYAALTISRNSELTFLLQKGKYQTKRLSCSRCQRDQRLYCKGRRPQDYMSAQLKMRQESSETTSF